MRRKWLSISAVLVGLLLVTAQAEAGVITYDLDLQDMGGGMVNGTTSLAPPQEVSAGDLLSLQTSFLSNQKLTIDGAGSNESLFFGLSSGFGSFSSVSDVTVTLLGFSGTNGALNVYVAPLATSPAYGNMLGVVLADFLADDQTISFTGYTVDFTVHSLTLSPQSYTQGMLVASNAVVAVPEPATYAVFGIGILAVGLGTFWKSRRSAELVAA